MDTSDPHSISPSSDLFQKVHRQKERVSPSTQDPTSTNTQQPITDQVTVSHGGTVHQVIQDILKQVPEVRQERIDQIRTALESGDYQVSGHQVADRLIKDILLNQPSTQD